MRVRTVRELRNQATQLMRDADPLLVTQRGCLAGVFIPWTTATLPTEWERELFLALSANIGRQLKKARVTEDDVLKDFDGWKKSVVRLAAEANFLLSALIGGSARLVLTHSAEIASVRRRAICESGDTP